MPAAVPPPSLADHRRAYARALVGTRDRDSNTRTGAGYDLLGGSSAILWARQGRHDRELFRECYRDTARGTALDARIERLYDVERIPEAYGTGYAILQRAAAGAAGTFYTGTRIELLGQADPAEYVITTDKSVLAADTTVAVEVRAGRTGTGVAVNAAAGASLRLGDSVFDANFSPIALVCDDGTSAELDADYIARAVQEAQDRRVGYAKRIIQACADAGAAYVVALDSGTFGSALDFGLNHVYVADAGFTTPEGLIKDCALALEAVRVGGCDLQVCGMTPTSVALGVTVNLRDDPGKFALDELKTRYVAALLNEFRARREFWLFRHAALAGAVFNASDAAQGVTVISNPVEPAAAFVGVLPRYTLVGTSIAITFTGPT